MNLWEKPTKLWQWPIFLLGTVLFWILTPVWIILGYFWWKQDSLFVILHIQAIMMNPWLLRD